MGFSSQNKQYAPNGNGCTRKVVNSVFSSMANFNSTINSSNSLMNHIRSWQRSRRLRSLNKNSVVNPMNNLCYQSMLAKSSSDLRSVSDFNCYKSSAIGLQTNSPSSPVVSFLNQGEGVIAMQLVNRVMVNENQLYSMQLSPSRDCVRFESGPHSQLDKTVSPDSCYEPLQPPEGPSVTLKGDPLNGEIWYYGNISREKAIQVVHNCATGSFVVRNSCTKKSCFALTVRVPYDYNHSGVAHYLIVPTDEARYRIKGFHKEFHTINSLIIHHSIMKEQLPCTLRLNVDSAHFYKTISSCPLALSTVNRYNSLYSVNSSQACANIYNTYGRSCGALNTPPDNQELMVDVDLDPTYQKILDNFRKVMAHCS